MNGIHEECGVFGIYSPNVSDVASTAYYALFALQHRGQESCGIVVNDDGVFSSYKDVGLVSDVFTHRTLASLGQGHIAVGHCLYGAQTDNARSNAQPMVIRHVRGPLAIAHNGNLINAIELRTEFENEGSIFHTASDTEVISYLITRARLHASCIEEAVKEAMSRMEGAYTLVMMSATKLIAARDPHGLHPLCYGIREDGAVIVASESCALSAVGARFVRDIAPGEILVVNADGIRSLRDHCETKEPALCVFEYIYFARPDSVIDGCSVHEARMRAGAYLWEEHPVEADVVIGVPDSGLDAALGFSRASGIPYDIGLIKNKYIGRTFIAPGQSAREDLVRIKLNAVGDTLRGKRVVMVDDSIVRGTTSARIVGLLREAGATEVHMRVSAPPFLNPCYYGTDIDSREHLIAVNHSVEEIARLIDVDSLGFLSIEHVKCLTGDPDQKFCSACFDGVYPAGVPTDTRKHRFALKLSRAEHTSTRDTSDA